MIGQIATHEYGYAAEDLGNIRSLFGLLGQMADYELIFLVLFLNKIREDEDILR